MAKSGNDKHEEMFLLDTNGYANDKHVKLIAQSFYMPKLHDF